MQPLYNINGLMFWREREITVRRFLEQYFAQEVRNILLDQNPAWQFHHIEAPLLTPMSTLCSDYDKNDIFMADQLTFTLAETPSEVGEKIRAFEESALCLRPETTPGSYCYATSLLEHQKRPPFVVWQAGKSFRKEQDQVTKNMRLKEFYQQEFQCFFSADTKNDYSTAVLRPIRKMFQYILKPDCEIVDSDRLPIYSLHTRDVMCDGMELCSISTRKDFTGRFNDKDILVLEIAIGLDRCVYQIESNRDIDMTDIMQMERCRS